MYVVQKYNVFQILVLLNIKRLWLLTLGRVIPSDYFASYFPVSVKGIFFLDDKIALLRNERDEWDLPGGKLKPGESTTACIIREIKEETNMDVLPIALLNAGQIPIQRKINVLVLIYSCSASNHPRDLKRSSEHSELRLFSPSELPSLSLSPLYLQAIKLAIQK